MGNPDNHKLTSQVLSDLRLTETSYPVHQDGYLLFR